MSVILQSDGRVALKVPDRFGDRIFWFSSISDSEVEAELADKYADPETGEVSEPVATLSRTPLELVAPLDDVKNQPLYRLIDTASKDDLVSLRFELSELVGKTTEVYEGVKYQSHARSGTDLLGNASRTLTLRLSYTRKTF